ncbi:MAG TPA: hypothetical protein VGO04_14130 [Ensifer sp.]|uniref:hypothetical protein n=1 Tax=Ensifer sp. TaxID=1872086 RepID=UPI002E0EA102|nr:hypothetical protein [Ensifer sp.]
MLSAVRSTIYHVLNWADKALSSPVAIDTFNEFQLRDIGLTRDQDHIRARVGDTTDPWHWPDECSPKTQPLPERTQGQALRTAAISPRATAGENKHISISLCD